MIRFAGPLAGTENGRIRVLLIARATNEADVIKQLSRDPWEVANRITTTGIEAWTRLVGTLESAANP